MSATPERRAASMEPAPEYKRTFFDRHGPDSMRYVKAGTHGLIVFGLLAGLLFSKLGLHWWTLFIALFAGAAAGGLPLFLSWGAGGLWSHIMVNGSSTPYVEQYSYQQALVMKGDVDGALASFEDIIANQPDAVSPRVKAAEIYVRERKNHHRAAELFREVQRVSSITTGEDIYVTNRLVDLLIGPLADSGRALVELRRLIDRHPTSPAAVHARATLTELKSRMQI